jgi:hypothetical protein
MFGQSTQSVMGKMTGLRARLRAIGAPSEHALYARKANTAQRSGAVAMPASARTSRNPKARLENDSASMIRNGIYSGSRS